MQATFLDANRDPQLQYYLNAVEQVYFTIDLDEKPQSQWARPAYDEICKKKDAEVEIWNSLLHSLTSTHSIRFKNMDFDLPHGYKAFVKMPAPIFGVIFYLSFIGNLFGCFYGQENTPLEKRPVARHPWTKSDGFESYEPCYESQIEMKNVVFTEVHKYFPGFVEFDNKYADYKIPEVQTFQGFAQNIDLFQVIFNTHIHGQR